jgi:hypothetical protein
MRRSRRAASGVHPPGKLDRMFAPGLCRLDVPATIDLSVCAIAASSSGCGPPSPVATPKLARLPSSHMERQYLSSRANRVMHARAQTRAHVRTRRRRGAVSRRRRYHTLAAFSWTGYCASAGLQHLASTVRSAGAVPAHLCTRRSRRRCASVGPGADVGRAGHDRATAVLLLASLWARTGARRARLQASACTSEHFGRPHCSPAASGDGTGAFAGGRALG